MDAVAPYAGAWIEILGILLRISTVSVAPYAGAWIEMNSNADIGASLSSLPTRERGLKFNSVKVVVNIYLVAPYAGAWIEIVASQLMVRAV